MSVMGSNALGIMFDNSGEYFDEIYIDIPESIYKEFDEDKRNTAAVEFIKGYLDDNPSPFFVVFDTESYTNNNMLLKKPIMWKPTN